MERAPLFYDRDCGVCRAILAGLLAWDRDGRLHPVEIQSPEAKRCWRA